MDRYPAPKADGAILVYLACVTAVLGLFALAFYALMQPTALPNAGLAQYKEPGRVAIFLDKIDTSRERMERMETVAIAAAEQGNREQGLSPLRAYASAAPELAASGAAIRSAPATFARPPKQAAPKRVVRREPVAGPWRRDFSDARRREASGPWRREAVDPWRREFAFGSNGGFGSAGSRPLWSGGRWD